MNNRPRRDRRRESGTALMLGTISLVFLIPMVGLAVDAGFLYAAKSKLQASVDGSSLAAARAHAKDELSRLHAGVKRFVNPHEYPVGLEKGLFDLRTELILEARGLKPR